jgi:hypothetical protein
MEKLYLGVDLHKRSCWVTVLDADGHLLESRRLGTEKWELVEYFGKLRKPAAVALARKLTVIAFYRWRHALHTAEKLPQVEKVRERSSGGAWSEHRPFTSD